MTYRVQRNYCSRRNHSIIQQDFLGISYKDSYISVSNSEKLLGVTIDNTLPTSTHVDSVINNCNTYMLSRINHVCLLETASCFTMHAFYPI